MRQEASKISTTDVRAAQSLAIISAEADEIDLLAKTIEENDIAYSSKRMTESYSRRSRGKNDRNPYINPNNEPEPDLL